MQDTEHQNRYRRDNPEADLRDPSLPSAPDIEEAVIGAMISDPESLESCLDALSRRCFTRPACVTLFSEMSDMHSRHEDVDLIGLVQRLREKGILEAVGGAAGVADLSGRHGTGMYTERNVSILLEKLIQRNLVLSSRKIIAKATDGTTRVDDLAEFAENEVYLSVQTYARRDARSVQDMVNGYLGNLERIQAEGASPGIPSGFPSLDRFTGGWQDGDLVILAARPSVGKTALALNIARNAAVAGVPVVFFSLEMSLSQLTARLLVSETGLDPDKVKGKKAMDPDEWRQLEWAIGNLTCTGTTLLFDETPSLPVGEFRSKLKNIVHTQGVRLAVVDYLQLMQGPAELKGMREQEVAAISRMLKSTAKDLGIPVIALSQLSRNAVQRQGGSGRPQLSDLRESGAIEQDADVVMFVHRPEAIGLDEESSRGHTEIIFAKNRNGQTGTVEMTFNGNTLRFSEETPDPQEHQYNP